MCLDRIWSRVLVGHLNPRPLIYRGGGKAHDVTYANIIAHVRRASRRRVPAPGLSVCGIVTVSRGRAPLLRPRGCSHDDELVNKCQCRACVIAWSLIIQLCASY